QNNEQRAESRYSLRTCQFRIRFKPHQKKGISFFKCHKNTYIAIIQTLSDTPMVNAIRLVPLFLYLVLCACSPGEVTKKEVAGQYPISLVDIRSVNLTDNFWLPRIKMIQDVTIPHSFEKCEHEGRMDNFLIAGNQ